LSQCFPYDERNEEENWLLLLPTHVTAKLTHCLDVFTVTEHVFAIIGFPDAAPDERGNVYCVCD
jgi:hypothetical protein